MTIPEYIGPCAFGIKMGVVVPGCDLKGMIIEQIVKADSDNLLGDGDVVCVTESVVARWQNNYVSLSDIAGDLAEKLALQDNHRVGVIYPILSRNRFAMILEGIAMAVPRGEVVVQLSFPCDEVGNQLITPEIAEKMLKEYPDGCIPAEAVKNNASHPITGVNYIGLYEEVISKTGASPVIYLSNDIDKILDYNPDAVIAADIHTREKSRRKIMQKFKNCCTLQDFFCKDNGSSWSEFGLLGSNMSAGSKIKLAPYRPDEFVLDLQKMIYTETGKNTEVIIYGDGAYKDPTTGIYELADPYPAFGATPGVKGVLRQGVKYKYLADLYHENGNSQEEIIRLMAEEGKKERAVDSYEAGGTTPRRMEDILASLADLVSGSADAGTPIILIKGIY